MGHICRMLRNCRGGYPFIWTSSDRSGNNHTKWSWKEVLFDDHRSEVTYHKKVIQTSEYGQSFISTTEKSWPFKLVLVLSFSIWHKQDRRCTVVAVSGTFWICLHRSVFQKGSSLTAWGLPKKWPRPGDRQGWRQLSLQFCFACPLSGRKWL